MNNNMQVQKAGAPAVITPTALDDVLHAHLGEAVSEHVHHHIEDMNPYQSCGQGYGTVPPACVLSIGASICVILPVS